MTRMVGTVEGEILTFFEADLVTELDEVLPVGITIGPSMLVKGLIGWRIVRHDDDLAGDGSEVTVLAAGMASDTLGALKAAAVALHTLAKKVAR